MTNEISHHHFKGHWELCLYLFHFAMKFMQANRIAPDGTPHIAASHLGLFSLPIYTYMTHKKVHQAYMGLVCLP